MSSQSIRWVGFGISNALTRTIVHFFPSEGGVTAPFPATCALRIFGQGLVEKKVVLEGARLSHPDGVRVEDAFPALKTDQVGLVGLEIEVATPQARVDLSSSGCVIELASKGHSAKYFPKRLLTLPTPSQLLLQPKSEEAAAPKVEVPRVAAVLRDAYSTSSIVVINGTEEPFRPALCAVTTAGESQELPVQGLAATAATETALEDSFFTDAHIKEGSWGVTRIKSVVLRQATFSEPKAVFLLYRDALTRRPVSVCAM